MLRAEQSRRQEDATKCSQSDAILGNVASLSSFLVQQSDDDNDDVYGLRMDDCVYDLTR